MSEYTQNETQQSVPVIKKPKIKRFIHRYFPLLLIVLVIVLAITSAYFYKKSTAGKEDLASQAEIKSLVEKVSRILVVPTDETPTVATVSDPDALKDQSFFSGAKKGDKVLIYSNAKKAVLYDPVADKIVMVAPLTMDTATQKTSTPSTSATTDTKSVTKKN